MSGICLGSVVVRSDKVLASPMGEEVVMIDLDSGCYFGLDEIGADIWGRLERATRVSDLCAALVRDYEVDPEVCARDVVSLLVQLDAKGLLEIAEPA